MKISNTTLGYLVFAILAGAFQSCNDVEEAKENVLVDEQLSSSDHPIPAEKYFETPEERVRKKIQEEQKEQQRIEDAQEKQYRKTVRKLSSELLFYQEEGNQSFYYIIADALYLHKKLVEVDRERAKHIFLKLKSLPERAKEKEKAVKDLAKQLIRALTERGYTSIEEKKVEKEWKSRKSILKKIFNKITPSWGNAKIELGWRENADKKEKLDRLRLGSDDDLQAFFDDMKFKANYFLKLQENPDYKNKPNEDLVAEAVRVEGLYKKEWREEYKKIKKDYKEVWYDYHIIWYSTIAQEKEKKQYYKSYIEKIEETGKAMDKLEKDVKKALGMDKGFFHEVKKLFK